MSAGERVIQALTVDKATLCGRLINFIEGIVKILNDEFEAENVNRYHIVTGVGLQHLRGHGHSMLESELTAVRKP